jgi:hypothetical protein
MEPFDEYIGEYKQLMAKGSVRRAYKGLMEYIMSLRTYFQNAYPDYYVSGSIYFGYMDMTYFSLSSESLKRSGLKTAIVFLHEPCRFEAWLAGSNKQVQSKFWKIIKASGWDKYPLVPSTRNADSIIEHRLVDNPDFSDLDALTSQIERSSLGFLVDVEQFLSTH